MPFEFLTNAPLAEARDNYIAAMRARGFAAGEETVRWTTNSFARRL